MDEPANAPMVFMTIRVPAEIDAALKKAARSDARSVSSMVRRILAAWAAQQEKAAA